MPRSFVPFTICTNSGQWCNQCNLPVWTKSALFCIQLSHQSLSYLTNLVFFVTGTAPHICLAALWRNIRPNRYVISHHSILWVCISFWQYKWFHLNSIVVQIYIYINEDRDASHYKTDIATGLPSIWIVSILAGMCMGTWSQTHINYSIKLLGLLPRIGERCGPQLMRPSKRLRGEWPQNQRSNLLGQAHLPGCHVKVIRVTWVKVRTGLKLTAKRFSGQPCKMAQPAGLTTHTWL